MEGLQYKLLESETAQNRKEAAHSQALLNAGADLRLQVSPICRHSGATAMRKPLTQRFSQAGDVLNSKLTHLEARRRDASAPTVFVRVDTTTINSWSECQCT